MSRLPENHPQRFVLANEIHARPYEALETPERVSYLAVLVEAADREKEFAHVVALCERYGVHPPPPETIHFTAVLGPFRLKWERHTEFSSYTFFVRGRSPKPFAEPASGFVPAEWLASIPGRTMVAAHAKLLPAEGGPPAAQTLAEHFAGNVVAGAEIGEGVGLAFTDFRVHEDGFSRFVVYDRSFTPRQAGRMLQRLFEIETYRTMALLALPIARRASARLAANEQALATLTETISKQSGSDEALLDQLTRLAAEVESALATSQYRFGASRAYYELVNSRIVELRERRIPGLQTIEEFMARRLAPAMATCESVARRLFELSERIARTSNLLSTRVDIVREKQNHALLESMNRRARLQLRLQETVEGLSVAAITYYLVGLVGYGAKALATLGIRVNPELAMGIAIPVVAILAALGVRHIRRTVVRRHEGER